jgi:hypothetical protein
MPGMSVNNVTRGREIKPPRIVLVGTEGVGKSTFPAGAEGSVFIPMKGERGLDQIDAAKFPVAQSYGDIIEAIGSLYQDQHDHQVVVIDSASAAEPLVWAETCTKAGKESIEQIGGGYGKGYIEALKYWREIVEGLDALRDDRGMASVIIGHVKTKEFNDPETDPYTQYQFDINEKAANLLYRWADCILFANYQKASVQKADAGFNKQARRGTATGVRKLYTEKRPAHPGKNRYGLPYEMPLRWADFISAVQISQQQGGKEVPAPKLATA